MFERHPEMYMLCRLTNKIANSWLCYETWKDMAYVVEALYRNDKLLYNALNAFESPTAGLVEETFNNLQVKKTRINVMTKTWMY